MTDNNNKSDIKREGSGDDESKVSLKYPSSIQKMGTDSEGSLLYNNIDDLWKKELQQESKWYSLADDYWKSVEPTVDGMLGGLSYVSDADIETSKAFLEEFFNNTHNCSDRTLTLKKARALDCGAGIGRVTQHLLSPLFDTTDLVEQNPLFIDEAKVIFKESSKVSEYYSVGLQDFRFTESIKYDCIWIQWVIGHLHDRHFIEFLNRCAESLNQGGMIFIKDNIAKKSFVMDKQDNSVTRCHEHLLYLFNQSNCHLVKSILQPNFPKSLFPVRLYALQPKNK